MGHGDFGHGGWGGEALLSGISFLVLAIVVVVFLGVLLLRNRGGFTFGGGLATPTPRPLADPALLLLRERYARGEIETAEYEERRHRLLDETADL